MQTTSVGIGGRDSLYNCVFGDHVMRRISFFVLSVLVLVGTATAQTTFEVVQNRIFKITESQDWTDQGWTDSALEGAVSKIAERLSDITGTSVKLPVGFDDVSPTVALGAASYKNKLIVGKRVTCNRVSNSIIIADEVADVAYAHNCLILSRGAVRIGHGGSNMVLAGRYIHVSHDNSPISARLVSDRLVGDRSDGEKPVAPPSVLVSGSLLDVSHAHWSICAGGKLVEISHAYNCQFVVSPELTPEFDVSHQHNCTVVSDKTSSLPALTLTNSEGLAKKLPITQIVGHDNKDSRKVVVKRGGVDTDVSIDDEFSELPEGWKLVFVEHGYALLSKESRSRSRNSKTEGPTELMDFFQKSRKSAPKHVR